MAGSGIIASSFLCFFSFPALLYTLPRTKSLHFLRKFQFFFISAQNRSLPPQAPILRAYEDSRRRRLAAQPGPQPEGCLQVQGELLLPHCPLVGLVEARHVEAAVIPRNCTILFFIPCRNNQRLHPAEADWRACMWEKTPCGFCRSSAGLPCSAASGQIRRSLPAGPLPGPLRLWRPFCQRGCSPGCCC